MSAFETLETAMTATGQVTTKISETWSIPSNQYQNTDTENAYVPSSWSFQEKFQLSSSNIKLKKKKSCASPSHCMQTDVVQPRKIFCNSSQQGGQKMVPSN
jgi:hypothetical protein